MGQVSRQVAEGRAPPGSFWFRSNGFHANNGRGMSGNARGYMAYELRDFCDDARSALKSRELSTAVDEIAGFLARLLRNQEFVTATFTEAMEPGKRELYHDPDLDFHVLAHVQAAGKAGAPHSHGSSWAVYGNAREVTEMTEYERINPESEEGAVLRISERYALRPGETRGYGPGRIHSTAHPKKAWVIRVTGTDLDHLPRFHFKRSRDRLLETA
jgi:hypothetical protein